MARKRTTDVGAAAQTLFSRLDRAARKRQLFTIAARSGVSYTAVRGMAAGEANPKLSSMVAVERALQSLEAEA